MRWLSYAVGTLVVLGTQGVQAQVSTMAPAIAYVSPQRAFAGSMEGKAALARLADVQAERQTAIAERQRELDTLEQGLTGGLTDDERARRRREADRFRLDIERFIEDAQAELMGLQREAENVFLAKFIPTLEDVARASGIQLVFNQDAGVIAWAIPDLDITPTVVSRLDATFVAAADPDPAPPVTPR